MLSEEKLCLVQQDRKAECVVERGRYNKSYKELVERVS